MKRIIAGVMIAMPLMMTTLATKASALEVIVNPGIHRISPKAELIARGRHRVLVPAHWEYRNHRRVRVPAHYEWRG
ncbi:MAG: hypothetical protein ACR2LR_05025 [Hassallia sp.]